MQRNAFRKLCSFFLARSVGATRSGRSTGPEVDRSPSFSANRRDPLAISSAKWAERQPPRGQRRSTLPPSSNPVSFQTMPRARLGRSPAGRLSARRVLLSQSSELIAILRAQLVARVNNPFLAGTIEANLASLYVELYSCSEAAEEIDQSIHFLSIARDHSAPRYLLSAYLIKADILYHQANEGEGRRAAERAISLAQELRGQKFRDDCLE